jgi:hypothetical protein
MGVAMIKGKTNNWAFKNWERHNRVISLLQQKRKNVTDLSHEIGELIPSVSACIWGVPGRQNPRIEGKIACFLGISKDELFKREEI